MRVTKKKIVIPVLKIGGYDQAIYRGGCPKSQQAQLEVFKLINNNRNANSNSMNQVGTRNWNYRMPGIDKN